VAGTCRAPDGVRPRRTSRVRTPIAGTVSSTGRGTGAAAEGHGIRAAGPSGAGTEAGGGRAPAPPPRDGESWTDVLQRPIRPDGAGYAYIDAYYQYPDGSIPLLLSGYGTVVVRVGPPFSAAGTFSSLGVKRRPQAAGISVAGAVVPQSAGHGQDGAFVIVLLVMAALMLGLAGAVRKRTFERGPIAVGPIVVHPIQLVAGAISLALAAIATSLIA
jgi:hypothetical protein